MISVFATFCLFAVAFGGRISWNDRPGIEERIVGGNQTEIEQVPYQIGLYLENDLVCGGSIIAPKYVVTSAQCVADFQNVIVVFKVRSGSANIDNGGVVSSITKVFVHPQYSNEKKDYDLAIIELETPLNFTKSIKAIKLADKVPADGQPVLVSGWGVTKEDGESPVYLHSVTVPMVNRQTCEKNYIKHMNITERMICAGAVDKDSCEGDGGGPLVYQGQLVGVVSDGVGCGRKDFPGIYTNVVDRELRNFIKKVANV